MQCSAGNAMQCIAMHCSAVELSKLSCSALGGSQVHIGAVQGSEVQLKCFSMSLPERQAMVLLPLIKDTHRLISIVS